MKKFFVLVLLAGILSLSSQVIKVIDQNQSDADFQTLSSAFEYLNVLDSIPEGGVIFNITAGQYLTEILPQLVDVNATEESPVIFHKVGTGENPIVALQNEASDISVISLKNCSYITFDGLSIMDPIPEDAQYYKHAFYLETDYAPEFTSTNITIKNCDLVNFREYGVYTKRNTSNLTIDNCSFTYSEGFDNSGKNVYAINVTSKTAGYIVSNNNFKNITSAENKGVAYIKNAGSSMDIYNNMLHFSGESVYFWGMMLKTSSSLTHNTRVLHNTIVCEGTPPLETAKSFGLYLQGSNNEVPSSFVVRNNIVINQRSGAESQVFYVKNAYPTPSVLEMDSNCFATSEDQVNFYYQYMDGGESTEVTSDSLLVWQNVSGQDSLSLNQIPAFVSDSDLHLAEQPALEFSGSFLSEVTHDIDGEIRNTEHPVLGADELDFYIAASFDLPDTLHFFEDDTLLIQFNSYVQNLEEYQISYMGNNDIVIEVENHGATISAPENWNGTEQISFTISNETQNISLVDTVIVIVNEVNDAPVLQLPDFIEMDEDTVYNLELGSYVSDIDDDDLSIEVEPGNHLQVNIDSLSVTINITANWYGTETIIFNVSDEQSRLITSDSLHVVVNSVDDLPQLFEVVPENAEVEVVNDDSLSFKLAVVDIDSELSYQWFIDDQIIETAVNDTIKLAFLENGSFVVKAIVSADSASIVHEWNISRSNYVGSENNLIAINKLSGNYPNPFNPSTEISYSLKQAGPVSIKIYNAKGQKIKTLVKGNLEAGDHKISWNGCDNSGKGVASGVYFYRMSSPEYIATKKMMLMK